ncbi:uncharacterized protein OCT59_022057 [Rhizophagus irregularis]|uniref:Uncharacterized protein n=1 Tax=Rhizophagus irregularis (strain DAOM 197198w) TaxID=1432141 RepID=A0A015MIA8_RHIIW|nr:hypothetical protein RirG_122270 [Rhizophagus irregularis DAOM 197198w]UZO28537.1 hypothetical protein OCT59_022057 [Rhizophagus irregularis]GBC36242.1 hypothetical protein GLOIN_2v1763773 [Rhizophagus irregularis DAOM 181602=DAOM 197198]
MAGITTRYVTENEFNTEMSIEELSKYAPALDILLTDKVKRDQVRQRLKKGYNFSKEQVFALIPKLTAGRKKGGALPNIPDTSDITQEAELNTVNTCQILPKETIRDLAQRIIRDNLGEAEVKVIAKALAESASNASAGVTGYAKNQGQQDIPQVFRSLEKNEERARELLVWIQEAISSRQLQDPGKLKVLWFNTFLKKDEFLPETSKPLLPSSLRKLGVVFAVISNCVKNLSVAITIASEVFHHSPNNHVSSAKNYTIVNYRKRGQPHDQAKAIKIFDEN